MGLRWELKGLVKFADKRYMQIWIKKLYGSLFGNDQTVTVGMRWFGALLRLAVVATLFYTPGYDGFLRSAEPEYIYWISLVPIALLFLALLLATGRTLLSAAITHLAVFVLNAINALKFKMITVPLLFEDMMFLQSPVASTDLLFRYVSIRVSKVTILLLILAVLIFLIARERPVLRLQRRIQFVLMIVVLLVLVPEKALVKRLYKNAGIIDISWYQSNNLNQNGFVTTFAQSMVNSKAGVPKLDRKALQKVHNSRATAQTVTAQRPDIIFYLSESFFDPGIVKGIDQCEFLQKVCQLRASGAAGDFDVSAFGGGTTITEFAVLTGIDPYKFGDQLRSPYRKLTRNFANSIAWELKTRGYRTIAIHPNRAAFYSRHIAMPRLGFDNFISRKDFVHISPKHSTYINDIDLNNKIKLHLKSDDQPTFMLAISMENHGPWGDRNIADRERLEMIEVPSNLEPKQQTELREYLYQLQYSEEALFDLIAWMDQRNRPTVLFYFGDHLPALSSVFEQLGFDNGESSNLQDTVFIYHKNYADTAKLPMRVAANQVAPLVLHDLDLLGPNEFYDLYRLEFNPGADMDLESRQYFLKQAQLQQLYWQDDRSK